MQEDNQYQPSFQQTPSDDFEQRPSFDAHPPEEPKTSKFSKKRIIIVAVGLLIIGGMGFGLAIWQEKNGDKVPASSSVQPPATPGENQTNTNADVPNVADTKTFKADFPRIEFTYPENWKVTENSEQEGVRVESPNFNYTSINGSQVSGYFRIYIRQGARQQDGRHIGRGVASVDSAKLTYSDPASEQRPETNLSFFGLDSDDNFAFFMIAGNFALKKGDSLGPNYGKEPETYIITGGYSSNELTEDLATNPVPLDYYSTTNAYKQALEILKSLKLL